MKKVYVGSLVCAALVCHVNADTAESIVKQSITTNSEMQVNELKTKALKEDIAKEESGYYPKVDFDVYFEKSKTKDDYKTGTDSNINKTGYKASIMAEQMLYDGKKTTSRVKEKEFNYLASTYTTSKKNEDIILDMMKSYTTLVRLKEVEQLLNHTEKAHAKSLEIAYKAEEISGDALETQKTLSMVNSQNDRKFAHIIEYKKALGEFKRLTSKEIPANVCRPKMDDKLIPATLEDAIKLALQNNYKIKEQLEFIKKQSQTIAVENSNFHPVVKLKLDASKDSDLELKENGVETNYGAKIALSWNFYSGGRDQSGVEKEKITLMEEKKNLEKLSNEVVEKTVVAYETLMQTKLRITNLEQAIEINKQILSLTRKQLEDGTKTFADELNAQVKLIDSQTNLVKQEFDLYNSYYELLNQFSILSSVVYKTENQMCTLKVVPDLVNNYKNESVDKFKKLEQVVVGGKKEESSLLEATVKQQPNEPVVTKVAESLQNTATMPVEYDSVDDIALLFKNSLVKYDKKNMNVALKINQESFTIQEVNPKSNLRKELDSFSKDLLNYIADNKDVIKEIKIESYTSSEFTSREKVEAQSQANLALSQRRANKVKGYFIKKAFELGIDSNLISQKVKAVGYGSTNLIYNSTGKEDIQASRRVIIKISL